MSNLRLYSEIPDDQRLTKEMFNGNLRAWGRYQRAKGCLVAVAFAASRLPDPPVERLANELRVTRDGLTSSVRIEEVPGVMPPGTRYEAYPDWRESGLIKKVDKPLDRPFLTLWRPCNGITWPDNDRCVRHGGERKAEYLKRVNASMVSKLREAIFSIFHR
tara:strand:- start:213 stop:695 length:483 start_codon:yes stop_codon:yes gene_type:complete